MRLSAPVVFRLRWASGPGAGRRGGIHARYIATRPGAARGEEPADPLVHARYLDERPGSTGLFGPDPGRPPELGHIQGGVRAAPWHWQMVLSLREDDARMLGLGSPADWRDLARRVLPQAAAALGLPPEALRWAAAVHHRAGHPHVHVLAWLPPGGPARAPAWSRAELRAVRRIVVRETYGPLRVQAVAQKTAERDFLLSAGRLNLAALRRAALEAQAEAPGPGRLPPAFPRADLRALARRVEALHAELPTRGQVRLAYMPPDVRAAARGCACWILERPQMAPALSAMEAAVRDLAAFYQAGPAAGDGAWDRARADVRDRIAQAVLRAAAAGPAHVPAGGAETLLRAAHRALEAGRLRAEARAELGRPEEERAARERAADMGLQLRR